MADAKKYYYMRLNESYFESDEQKILESMPDGYLYSNILLKLYLKSLRRDGLLMFNDRIPYNAQMIATITRHQVGTVEKAMVIFQQLGIVEIMDSGAIYMLDVQNFVGKTTTEADRIRAYRARIEAEKQSEKALPEPDCTNVQEQPYICTPEIELEKELELKKKIKGENAPSASAPAKRKKSSQKSLDDLIKEYTGNFDLQAALADYVQMRKKIKKPLTNRAIELVFRKLDELASTDHEKVAIVNQSIMNSWQGLFPIKDTGRRMNNGAGNGSASGDSEKIAGKVGTWV